ncbi:hypothetical protein llap_8666 [Limosa lapponica baueri]|uniref:Uncharacterized protein n=1 Tax=Limosa lapponica baueri TaxID=1758121 RepID=A0A2I0U4R5_LIMLA|nr:hypothetical protein llap_8666 [Limosa lapponica baueri]
MRRCGSGKPRFRRRNLRLAEHLPRFYVTCREYTTALLMLSVFSLIHYHITAASHPGYQEEHSSLAIPDMSTQRTPEYKQTWNLFYGICHGKFNGGFIHSGESQATHPVIKDTTNHQQKRSKPSRTIMVFNLPDISSMEWHFGGY